MLAWSKRVAHPTGQGRTAPTRRRPSATETAMAVFASTEEAGRLWGVAMTTLKPESGANSFVINRVLEIPQGQVVTGAG